MNAYQVILILAVAMILAGAWLLVSAGNEPTHLIMFLLGAALAAGVLARMSREKSSVERDAQEDSIGRDRAPRP